MSFATSLPLFTNLAFLLGLSLFFGLAFEEFYAHQRTQPGGVRTFPLLALAGAMLYLLDATHLIPVSVGVLVLGAWLYTISAGAAVARRARCPRRKLACFCSAPMAGFYSAVDTSDAVSFRHKAGRMA